MGKDCDDPNRGHRRGVLLVLSGAALWSTAGLLLRIIDADEITTIFWRAVFAAAALTLYLLRLHGARIAAVMGSFGWPHCLVAACFAADAMLFVLAINRTSVANVMIVFALSPFVAAVLAWAILRERIGAGTWTAMAACVLGVIIMMAGSAGRGSLGGDLIAVVVVLVFAVGVVTIRRHPEIDMIPAVWLSATLTAVVSFPFAEPLGLGASDYLLLAFFGVFEHAVALVAFTVGASYIPAAHSTLIALLENVLAPLWVWLVVHEVPGTATLMGGLLILTTLLLHTAYAGRRSPRPSG